VNDVFDKPLYQIETGVPLPTGGRPIKYPLRDMQVGDSFLIPAEDHKAKSIYQSAKQAGVRITTRAQPDGSLRVWRLE
jgi:hypothetical protein